MPHGRTGTTCFVDLTTESIRTVKSESAPDMIGGRGGNQRLLFDLQPEGSEAFDPQNPLILGAGPLVGTMVPGACRLAVDFRNLITGGVGSANLGGHFAAEMKYAGLDHIVIQGRARRPVYLYITDEGVSFRDAAPVWGLDTWDAENRIKRLENEPCLKTVCIGPGRGKPGAFRLHHRRTGDGPPVTAGSGAIFGAKNLKAIAVRGGASGHRGPSRGAADRTGGL